MNDYWQKFEEDQFYHIYNRTINREQLFSTTENYDFFLQRWSKYLGCYLETYSYALLPNHFHFLVRCKEPDQAFIDGLSKENTVAANKFKGGEIELNSFLEDQFKRFFTSYAKAFNSQQNRTGNLFQKRYKRIKLKDEFRIAYKGFLIKIRMITFVSLNICFSAFMPIRLPNYIVIAWLRCYY